MTTLVLPQRLQGSDLVQEFAAFPLDGYVPDGGKGLHDPAVIAFGDRYFCFHTGGPGFCSFLSSRDLMHWNPEGPILDAFPDWLRAAMPNAHSVWAPEASKFGEDGLRLYYCASARFGHNDSSIGLAQCDHFDPAHPTRGWRDLGLVVESVEGRDAFNAIDPSVLTGPDGRVWMYFGSYWSGLYVSEVDPLTGKLKSTALADRTLIARNPADKANGLEAPCCVYRDGFYYLFLNYGLAAQGVRSTYQLVVGRSRDPKGPFVDHLGKPMTEGGHESVLNSTSPLFGPGGGVEFQDQQGRWLMSYHFYDGRAFWHDHTRGLPTLQVRELDWTEDGWPVPGLPICPQLAELDRHPLPGLAGKWRQQVDFGAVGELTLRPDGSCSLGDHSGSWTAQADHVELRWPSDSAPNGAWVDRLDVSHGGHYAVGRNQAGNVIRAFREGS